MPNSFEFLELSGGALRQYINARQVLSAYREAVLVANEYAGSMIWREQNGRSYLVRTSPQGKQKGLGRKSPETEEIFTNFHSQKERSESRRAGLRRALQENERLNKALWLGQVPTTTIDVLNALNDAGLEQNFTVIETNALHAYGASAGVLIEKKYLNSGDADAHTKNKLKLTLAMHQTIPKRKLLSVFKGVDKSFDIKRSSDLYSLVNSRGYEICIVQSDIAERLLNAPKFKEMIVDTRGRMAILHTIAPRSFIDLQRWLSLEAPDCSVDEQERHQLLAEFVQALLDEYLLISGSLEYAESGAIHL